MGKLIDKLKPGMHMREVRKIIPFKPWMIVPEIPMMQQVGQTIWFYANSKGLLKIFFKDAIYIGHEITPTLDEMNRQKEILENPSNEVLTGGFKINLSQEKLKQIQKQFNTWNSCPDQLRL